MSFPALLIEPDSWDYRRRHHLHDWDSFGHGVTPSEIHNLLEFPRLSLNSNQEQEELQCTQIGKDGFQACIDVKQFKPKEISVKVIDSTVVVEAKHEDRADYHGFISRHFVRKYQLPQEYDINYVSSSLSSDGILSVKAPPLKDTLKDLNHRIVPIHQTGPAHLNIKKNPAEQIAET